MAGQKPEVVYIKRPGGKGVSRILIAIVVVSAIVIICTALVIPFIKVPVEVVETYTDTDYKQEAYTESEPYEVTGDSIEKKSETFYADTLIELGRRVIPDRWGTEVYFTIDLKGKSNPVVSGSWEVEDFPHAFYVTITDPGFNFVYQYKGSEVATQSDDFQFMPEFSGTYLMRFSTDYVRLEKYARLDLVLTWNETSTTTAGSTEYREVTKYREVPVQVEKQRTVTKYERVSIWGLLFK
jgi:hypothetical protein